MLADGAVEDEGIDGDSKGFEEDPPNVARRKEGNEDLEYGLHDHRCVVADHDDVVLLRGGEDDLPIVDEVAKKRGVQHREEHQIDYIERHAGIGKDKREKTRQDEACRSDNGPYAGIEEAKDGDDVGDGFAVIAEEGLVERHANSGANAQLGDVHQVEHIAKRSRQPHKLLAEVLKKILA